MLTKEHHFYFAHLIPVIAFIKWHAFQQESCEAALGWPMGLDPFFLSLIHFLCFEMFALGGKQ